MRNCPLCTRRTPRGVLEEAAWLDAHVLQRLARAHPRWRRRDGACPACVQEALLESLLLEGRDALEGRVQSVWPIDSEAAFGALPTPLRLRADPRFRGAGRTIAVVDGAFFPHPDLVRPANRIRAWVDASRDPIDARWFTSDDVPAWPEPPGSARGGQWHGLMTSVTAAGNGWLSHGLYRGLASESTLALVSVGTGGAVSTESICRALRWLRQHARELALQVVNLSVAGDEVRPGDGNPIDEEIAALAAENVVVVAAAGNDGRRHLLPPATAADAITVGGLDDHSILHPRAWELWHSNYGAGDDRTPKPEVVAPSLWTVAPVLPGSDVAEEAHQLFRARASSASEAVDNRIAALHLVTPHYQHVEGTSFAAPVVASVVACMREANARLAPQRIKELLMLSAVRIDNAPDERQGAGVVDAGLAVAAALADAQRSAARLPPVSFVDQDTIQFVLHDRAARSVAVLGSWDNWQAPGIAAAQEEPGVWRARVRRPDPGLYSYKYLVNDSTWLPDPANPLRMVNDAGQINSVVRLSFAA
jgi:serine protease AprX